MLREADCGLLCASEDCKGFAGICRQFEVADADVRKAWGANARRYYQDHYEREKFFDSFESLLMGENGKECLER